MTTAQNDNSQSVYLIDRMMATANYHWSNKEYEESLAIALVGIAAVSKLYYPNENDGNAYKQCVKDKLTEIISRYLNDLNLPGTIASCVFGGRVIDGQVIGGQSLEEILYKTLRNNIVHELIFPNNIRFADHSKMCAPFELYDNGTIVFANRLPLALIYTVLDDPKVLELRIQGKMMAPSDRD